jgi:hypothetical protein
MISYASEASKTQRTPQVGLAFLDDRPLVELSIPGVGNSTLSVDLAENLAYTLLLQVKCIHRMVSGSAPDKETEDGEASAP